MSSSDKKPSTVFGVELPDGPTEESTERDGAFSYAGEVHAFVIGFGVGVAAVTPVPQVRRFVWELVGLDVEHTRTDAMLEAKSESWYALGGMYFGMFWAVLVYSIITLGMLGVL